MLHYYNKAKFYIIGLLLMVLLFIQVSAFAQVSKDSSDKSKSKNTRFKIVRPGPSSATKSIVDLDGVFTSRLPGISIGGYFRGYGYGRSMNHPYDGLGANKVYTIGDGYYNPLLYTYIGGNPTANTSFGIEFAMGNPWEAFNGPGNVDRTINTYNTMVMRGNTNTDYGKFGIVAGGIEWQRLTPFTFGQNISFQRYSLWERKPWDPGGNLNTRYSSYYYNGTINQDARFGTNAFKGFMLNGYDLPFNTTFDFFYGKTANNGGYDRESIVKPKSNIGAKIVKKLKNGNNVGLNTFNSYTRTDSVNGRVNVHWSIITTDFNINFKGFNLNGEIGAGNYSSPNYKNRWSEGIIVNLVTPKKYTLIPLSLRYFEIGQSFTSNVAMFSNTSIREVYNNNASASGPSPTQVLQVPFAGNMGGVGSLANNRRGVALNTDFKIWKLKFNTGLQMEGEMNRLNNGNTVSFNHNINALAWSRLPLYYPLTTPMGPNQRVHQFYQGASEVVNISDTLPNGTPQYKRMYNSFDFQVKFKNKIFNKDFYMYFLNTYMSVQNTLSPVPVLSNSAYIRAQYHELEAYYQVNRNFLVSMYGGLELVKGNSHTDLTTAATGVNGVAGLARNQIGKSLGVGLDVLLSNSANIYFRQRWFSFDDRSFNKEEFQGQESTIELKIFF
jgi:hypothetical protein